VLAAVLAQVKVLMLKVSVCEKVINVKMLSKEVTL